MSLLGIFLQYQLGYKVSLGTKDEGTTRRKGNHKMGYAQQTIKYKVNFLQ